jgi:hypothetical protein
LKVYVFLAAEDVHGKLNIQAYLLKFCLVA